MSAVHTEFQTQPLRMSEIPFFRGGHCNYHFLHLDFTQWMTGTYSVNAPKQRTNRERQILFTEFLLKQATFPQKGGRITPAAPQGKKCHSISNIFFRSSHNAGNDCLSFSVLMLLLIFPARTAARFPAIEKIQLKKVKKSIFSSLHYCFWIILRLYYTEARKNSLWQRRIIYYDT